MTCKRANLMCAFSFNSNLTALHFINKRQVFTCMGTVLQMGRSLVRFQMVSLEFFIDIKSFRSHYGPGVDSASNRNEYQKHILGVKAADA